MIKGGTLSLLAVLLVLLWAGGVRGDVVINTPRALGMGNAFIAVSDDEGAVSSNPAGLALIRQGLVSFGSLGLTNKKDYWYSSYIIPSSLKTPQCTALSFSQTKDIAANTRTDSATWSAGQYYAEGTAVGLSLHYLRTSDDTAGTQDKAFGVDLGVLYSLPEGPGGKSLGSVGVLVQNPNEPKMLGQKLPRVISVGVATRIIPRMLLAADSYNVFDEAGAPQERSVGVELMPAKGVFLRGGYLSKEGVFTLGAGIRSDAFHLDAGWVSKDGGNDTSFMGMSFLF
jgi:hypothetical protein